MLWPSIPGAPLFAFTDLKASHTIRFEMANGFDDLIGSSRKRLTDEIARTTQSLRSTYFRRLHRYYGLFRPCAPHRYLHARGDHPLALFPWHRGDRFSRSIFEPDPS